MHLPANEDIRNVLIERLKWIPAFILRLSIGMWWMKNPWRRYQKNIPIICNRHKQKRKSDRRKLHPQTKNNYRVFLSFTRRIPHKTATSLESIVIVSCYALCCDEYILRDFPFVSFQLLLLWTGFEFRLQCVFPPNVTSVLVQRPRRKQTLCCGCQI